MVKKSYEVALIAFKVQLSEIDIKVSDVWVIAGVITIIVELDGEMFGFIAGSSNFLRAN